ncbi:hypothetical protein P3T39_000353 [Kitasatospora sp. GP82]|nr:hypothetical protein [Kitasatospora sp. GP82]
MHLDRPTLFEGRIHQYIPTFVKGSPERTTTNLLATGRSPFP